MEIIFLWSSRSLSQRDYYEFDIKIIALIIRCYSLICLLNCFSVVYSINFCYYCFNEYFLYISEHFIINNEFYSQNYKYHDMYDLCERRERPGLNILSRKRVIYYLKLNIEILDV